MCFDSEPTETLAVKHGADGYTYYLDMYKEKNKNYYGVSKDDNIILKLSDENAVRDFFKKIPE